MNVVGWIISGLIAGGMLSFIGLAIYQQILKIQKINGKDKKSKKEKTKKGGE